MLKIKNKTKTIPSVVHPHAAVRYFRFEFEHGAYHAFGEKRENDK